MNPGNAFGAELIGAAIEPQASVLKRGSKEPECANKKAPIK